MSTRDELAKINATFEAALGAQDADGVAGLFMEDARLLFSGVPMMRGRAAIAASFADDLRAGPVSTHFESQDVLEDGRLVVDVGRYVTPPS